MSSLRARLLLLVAVVLIPSFVLLLAMASRERNLRLEAAQATALQLVDVGVRDQQAAISDGLRILRAFGMLAGVRSGDETTCANLLATLADMLDEGWSVTRTRADGLQDCATRSTSTLPRNVSDSPVFQQVRAQRTPVVGAYVRSVATSELLLPLNVPMLSERGAFAGVLSTGLRLHWFDRLSATVAQTPEAVVNIVAGGDRILRRSPPAAADAPAPAADNPITRAMRTQQRGLIDAPGLDSVRRVWAFDRLPSADTAPVWLLVGLPADAVYASANAQLLTMLLALAVWLVLVIAVGWWATDRFVVQDVHRLLATTERIGRGDLAARTGGLARTDELAQLAASVDQMAARLHDRQEREAQAQKLEAIGQLAGGVAHDFNNLLTAIIGNTEIARDLIEPTHPARGGLDESLEAAARSAALTRQLLTFARRSELAPRVVRVDRLLQELLSLLRRIIGEHITLELQLDPDLPLARIDTGSIEQAIVNLVVNARDAMPSGGHVTIAARRVTVRPDDLHPAHGVPAGEWLSIAVQDDGTGMPPEVLAHAFEPFFTTKPVGRGTGLGLPMVYGTVRQHDGHVRVDSVPGQGTTVWLYLPPTQAAVEDEPPPVPRAELAVGRSRRVLLVEDEPAVRTVVERMLQQAGYAVRVAGDGAAALALCDDQMLGDLDLLVSDVVMPNMGGVELVRAMRERRADLPVLFVSGYRETHAVDALLEMPRTAMLDKPFTSLALLHAVQQLLDDTVTATG